MSDSKTLYKLREAEERQRLAEIAATPATVTDSEVHLLKYLVERHQDSPALVERLIATMGKAASASHVAKVRDGQMISRDTMIEYARRIMDLVSVHFADVPDYPDRIDNLCNDIMSLSAATKDDPKLLEKQ